MAVIKLTQADAGRLIVARRGDDLLLELGANPTTGFEWKVNLLEGQITLVSDEFVTQATTIGSGGLHRFKFSCSDLGAASIELFHWRPWEGESGIRSRPIFKLMIEQ